MRDAGLCRLCRLRNLKADCGIIRYEHTARCELVRVIRDEHSAPYENSWEPMENLSNAKEAIEDYEAERQVHQPAAKKSKGKKRGRPRKGHV